MVFEASILATATVSDLVRYLQLYIPQYTYQVYFSTGVFIITLLGGCYLLLDWLKHQKRDPLMVLWALGLLLTYWIQIPTLLANGGMELTVTDLNLIFAIATPLSFLGILLILAGVVIRISEKPPVLLFRIFSLWFLVSILFFLFVFEQGSKITSYAPATLGAIAFFLPALFLIVILAARLERKAKKEHNHTLSSGARFLAIGAIVQIAAMTSGFIAIVQYPPGFWFVALLFATPMLFFSTLAKIILLFSFLLMHADGDRRLTAFTPRERALIHEEFGIRIGEEGTKS